MRPPAHWLARRPEGCERWRQARSCHRSQCSLGFPLTTPLASLTSSPDSPAPDHVGLLSERESLRAQLRDIENEVESLEPQVPDAAGIRRQWLDLGSNLERASLPEQKLPLPAFLGRVTVSRWEPQTQQAPETVGACSMQIRKKRLAVSILIATSPTDSGVAGQVARLLACPHTGSPIPDDFRDRLASEECRGIARMIA